MRKTEKGKLRTGRVLLAMGIIVGSLSGVDGIRRGFGSKSANNITVDGNFREITAVEPSTGGTLSLTSNTADPSEYAFSGIENIGFTETVLSKEDISKGRLAVYTESSPAKETDQRSMVDLGTEKNEFYTLCEEHIYLNSDAAEALNLMMEQYANETSLADFIVYGTTDTYTGAGSFCPMSFPESKSGYCVDLALNGYDSVLTYDGRDAEGWIVENCWKYGFTVRYPNGKKDRTGREYCPWHLRYVGDIHAAIMNQKKMCLEEYTAFLKQYTFKEPYSFSFNDTGYQIYSVSENENGFSTSLPISGYYELSGDNSDSFIVTMEKK